MKPVEFGGRMKTVWSLRPTSTKIHIKIEGDLKDVLTSDILPSSGRSTIRTSQIESKEGKKTIERAPRMFEWLVGHRLGPDRTNIDVRTT